MSIADFQCPELWGSKRLLFQWPVCGILLRQPEQTHTPLHPCSVLQPKGDFLLRGKTKTKTIPNNDEISTVPFLADRL